MDFKGHQAPQTKAQIANEVWAALPPEAKEYIKALRAKRQVKVHEVTSDLDEMDPDADDQAPESPDNGQDPDNPLLDFICGDTDSPTYGDIREVLATQRKKKPFRKRVNPKQSTQDPNLLRMNYHNARYEISILYRISINQRLTVLIGSLVDRGANGGLLGDDVLIIFRTGRTVDVAGIDGHTVNDLELVTAAALVETNVGLRIIIMHQYAYLGKGKTIHSSGQLEHYKNEVHDRSKAVGGKQCIITPDGVVIPLSIRSGLPYMDMRVPTKEQLETIPHIVLTADTPWDPRVLDCEYKRIK
jgi:hypothetical protein